MRFSLIYQPEIMPTSLADPQYAYLEQQVLAAELSGFAAIWLSEPIPGASTAGSRALRIVQHLSSITDRLDLGLHTSLPDALVFNRWAADLLRLDDLSGGRCRLALTGPLEAQRDASAVAVPPWLNELARQLGFDRALRPAQRLLFVATDAVAALAGGQGYGLLLPTTGSLHTHHLALARYHLARAAQPGWVARVVPLVVVADPRGVAEVQRRVINGTAPLSYADAPYQQPIIGTCAEVTAKLAALHLADGLDEVACQVHLPGLLPETIHQTIELLGRFVLPHFQSERARSVGTALEPGVPCPG
jgi:alkanesulfonate monooxygenase SsuD/methylene tetrahydromethanopterin reductase-like flavin-dependent oxidoreductase (luciferase family)